MESIIIGIMAFLSVGLLLFGVVMAIDLNRLIDADVRQAMEEQRNRRKSQYK